MGATVPIPKKRYVQPTTKGQITLPAKIRRELAISPDTLLLVSIQDGRILLQPVANDQLAAESWETVVDFTQFATKGIAIDKLQSKLKRWTKSTKPSIN